MQRQKVDPETKLDPRIVHHVVQLICDSQRKTNKLRYLQENKSSMSKNNIRNRSSSMRTKMKYKFSLTWSNPQTCDISYLHYNPV